MNAVKVELATALQLIHEQAEKTDLNYTWMMTLRIWGIETRVLGAEALAATKERRFRKEIRRPMARARSDLQVPIDVSTPPEEPETFKKGYGDELVRALLYGIHRDAR